MTSIINNDESLTPRVRTIFRVPRQHPHQLPPGCPQAPRHHWPSLVEAILTALLPFHDAWQAARQVIRQARDRIPVSA